MDGNVLMKPPNLPVVDRIVTPRKQSNKQHQKRKKNKKKKNKKKKK